MTTVSPFAPARFPELPEVAGVELAAVAAGIRYADRLDLALVRLPPETTVAGVFTTNRVVGHPVVWCRRILPAGRARALVVNAGNANVFRGAEGDAAVAAEARAVEVGGATVRLAGIAKGAGMIAPDLATMLAFLFTDARIPAPLLQRLLAEVTPATFGSLTVDGDTSTSDTVLLFATGRRGPPLGEGDGPLVAAFRQALFEVCRELAVQIAKDGEGIGRFVEITVEGAVDEASARRIGLTVANSPLVKTAIAGGDPNWGRIVAAVGRAGEPIEPERLAVAFGGYEAARDGRAIPDLDETPLRRHLEGREVRIEIRVGDGPGRAVVWTCDLTHGYVDINASYRS